MKKAKILSLIMAIALMAAFVLGGCSNNNQNDGEQGQGEEPPQQVELFISAAASLSDVSVELAEAYKTVAPNVTLTYTLDSSGTLQTQIEEGAPADIFISAAEKQMNALEEKDLLNAETRKDLLKNKVVLIVPVDSEADITSFEDVVTDKVGMIAIGEASVPVGQYTEDIYTHLGLWDQVTAKSSFGTNVRAVLAWVEGGEVDCGIVYATDAASTDKVKVVSEAPEGSHKAVIYPVSALANSANPEEAQAFVEFLFSDTAKAIFEAAGFSMAD